MCGEKERKSRKYSRRQLVGNFMCQTRIDFILASRNIEGFIEKLRYEETSLSDHKPLFMQLTGARLKEGRGCGF